MAMANMNLTGVFVTKLWPVQALACGGGDGGSGGGATKTIISPKFSNFGDIINHYTTISILEHSIINNYSTISIGFLEYTIINHYTTIYILKYNMIK